MTAELVVAAVRDAGLTQVAAGTETVLATKPGTELPDGLRAAARTVTDGRLVQKMWWLRAEAMHDPRDVGERSCRCCRVNDALRACAQMPHLDLGDAAVTKLVLHDPPHRRGV